MHIIGRSIRPKLLMLVLLVTLASSGCRFRLDQFGLLDQTDPQEAVSALIQLSPPAEIMPDQVQLLEATSPTDESALLESGHAASSTPFQSSDPSLTPKITLTLTTTHTLLPGTQPVTATFTPTLMFSPTASRTHTITATLPPGTLPPTLTHTATRTATAVNFFTPTWTPTDTQQPPTPPPPTATYTPEPTVPTTCDPSGNGSFESALIGLINQERQSRGLGTLSPQALLNTASRNHSADMACHGFFSHTGSDGSLPWDRVSALGYNYSAIAENIFAGSSNAQTAFDAWMNSPGHRDNMLNPHYTEIGVGYRYWADSPYGAYTTAVFAHPR